MIAGMERQSRDSACRDGGEVQTPLPGTPTPPRTWLASVFSVALLLVVASPVVENWKAEPFDDFPLSYFPMFSRETADDQRVTYLIGLNPSGERYLLPYGYAGRGGMNQVRKQMNKLVGQGDASKLCETAASRVNRQGSRLPEIRTVEVITGRFSLSGYFTGTEIPTVENVRARCSVARGRS